MDSIETKYPADLDTNIAQGDAIESFGASQNLPSEPERQDETVNTEPIIDAVGAPFSEAPQHQALSMPCNSSVLGQRPLRELDEIRLAERPSASPIFSSPVLSHEIHRRLVADSVAEARRLGKLVPQGAIAVFAPIDGVFTLAQWQSPFKLQNDRGTCWAFAGAAALEAAYRRKFNMVIDVSEEYVFHMGKSFALNQPIGPIENNTSLTGFQGS